MELVRIKVNKAATALEALKGRVPHLSLNRLQSAFSKGLVSYNDKILSAEELLQANVEVAVHLTAMHKAHVFAEDIPIIVLHEDEHLLVVIKPHGMACHAGLGIYKGTLLNALKHYHQLHHVNAIENGLVHRLDAATSGIMVIARTKQAMDVLNHQFKSKQVNKVYRLEICGELAAKKGSITLPIGRNPHNDRIIEVRADGKAALTHYHECGKTEKGSLILAQPITGRTHQLRIHFASIGHPIVGDKRYQSPIESSILHLQAIELSFQHPLFKDWMHFKLEPNDFTF